MVTVDPSLRLVPAIGVWETTEPAPTVIDFTGAPIFRFIWTLATSARAWVNGKLTRAGVGCEGVNTLASKAATSPPTTRTAATIAATIHHVRRRLRARAGVEPLPPEAAPALPP